MISFKKLGDYGRLGNQLFQYAFLRTTAKRLEVSFYCPAWVGDNIFMLDDADERAAESVMSLEYNDTYNGFNKNALTIQDGTEITGFFQSDKYFSRDEVTKWFSFKEDILSNLIKKYQHIDFSKATAIHVRLGDYATPQLVFYTPRPEYFTRGLQIINQADNTIVVFSDDVTKAQDYLKDIQQDIVFIEGNKDYEDLYLMTLCRNVVCSPSSFSWWGAYLNKYADKKIIIPQYWFLPGGKASNSDIFVDGWIKVKAHRWYDYYYIKYVPNFFRRCYLKISRILSRP